MNSIIQKFLASFLILGILAACAETSSDNTIPELTTTEIGVAAGAVIGAGLGAIIGSTAGNAGEGLVVGSLAGAATGALVGDALETQEAKLEKNQNILRQQDEALQEQRREVEELRRQNHDRFGSASPRSSGSFSEAEVNLPLAGAGHSATPLGTASAPTMEDREYLQPPSRMPEARHSRAALTTYEDQEHLREEIAPSRSVARAIPKRTAGLPDAAQKADEQPQILVEPEPFHPITENKSSLDETNQVARSITPSEPVARIVQDECVAGASEAERADKATSQADKLFYLRRAIRLCPNTASYYVKIGQVYARIGREEDARMQYQKALDLDPSNQEVVGLINALGEDA